MRAARAGLPVLPVAAGVLLGFGAAWPAASSAVVLGLPAVRAVRWRPAGPPADRRDVEGAVRPGPAAS